jgi:tetratricopeptide (TPR) repeat protein
VQTRDNARRLPGLSGEQAAWFELRVGDIALRNGRLGEAEKAFRAGLETHPEDYRLLAAMARVAVARHDWRAGIDWGDRAIARHLDPATLALVGDAYRALGDSAKSEEYYRVLEVSLGGQTGAFHRAWSLALLDRGRSRAGVAGEGSTRESKCGRTCTAGTCWRGRCIRRGATAKRPLQ